MRASEDAPASPSPAPLPAAQRALLGDLANAQAREHLAHAFLLVGAAGIGKRRFALAFAQQLVCPTARAQGCACLACRLPLEELAAGRHPDIHLLAAGEGRGVIGVESIREGIVRAVQLRSFTGSRQAYILEETHRYSPEAQNTLLKTLEEPSPGVHLLLTSDSSDAMLETVRSRCHRLQVPAPTDAELAAQVGARVDDPAIRMAAGSTERWQAASSTGFGERLADLEGWLAAPTSALQLVDVLVPDEATTSLKSQADVVARLDELAYVLAQAARAAPSPRTPFTLPALVSALRATWRAKIAVQSYVDPSVATLRLAERLRDVAVQARTSG